MKELVWEKECRRGSRGKDVRRVQEWLSLSGFGIVPDGDYGAATEFAVRQFQSARGITVDGVVGEQTFGRLTAPMAAALESLPPSGNLGEMVVSYARHHLEQGPREIGGQNRGPWVRLYMKGHEGAEWPWCAGFACFVLEQACKTLRAPLPIRPSFSCDSLAASAKERGLFQAGRNLDPADLKPGMFFLSRRTATDWTHVGIVVEPGGEVFSSIEGNTNDEGSREGYEVCLRVRGVKGMDFIGI